MRKDWIWNYLIEPFTVVLSYNKLPIDYFQAYYGFIVVALLLAIIRRWEIISIPLPTTNAIIMSAIVWGLAHTFLIVLYYLHYPSQRSGAALLLFLSWPSFIILAILITLFFLKK